MLAQELHALTNLGFHSHELPHHKVAIRLGATFRCPVLTGAWTFASDKGGSNACRGRKAN
jgi:hypothetical protein